MKKTLLLLLLIQCFCLSIYGHNYMFKNLGVKQGLSQSAVLSIAQDSLGRIWLGTRDGLNCYDGEYIQSFHSIRNDSTSLLGHTIRDILSQDSYLWVLTHAGVCRFSLKTESVERFDISGVESIFIAQGTLYASTEHSLARFDTKHHCFVPSNLDEGVNCVIQKIIFDKDSNAWFATDNGLFVKTKYGKKVERLLDQKCITIKQDSKDRMWIGTENQGCYCFISKDSIQYHFSEAEKGVFHLSNNFVRTIEEDDLGSIWIGTFLGVNVYKEEKNRLDYLTQNRDSHFGLSHNSVYKILKDSQGTLWIGTYFGGVDYYNPKYQPYDFYASMSHNRSLGVSYSVVGKMVEEENGNIWIATEGGGLDHYDKRSQRFSFYKSTQDIHSLSHNNVKSLFLTDSILYVGTHMGGLNAMDLNTYNVNRLAKYDSLCLADRVSDIIPYKERLLLATAHGVIEYNPILHRYTPFFKNDSLAQLLNTKILTLLDDSEGLLWIGTERDGLYCYNPRNNQLRTYKSSDQDSTSIGSNSIYSIYEDHQFRVWIATMGGGLSRYHRQKDSFISYSHAQGQLSSDFVYGVQESRYGAIWVATSKGLDRMDIENKQYNFFTWSNGFPITELNEGAILLTRSGDLFVGGLNGLTTFSEKELMKEVKSSHLIFTNFSIEGYRNGERDKKRVEYALPFVDHIEVPSNVVSFSISISACNYIPTRKIGYQYSLDDKKIQWVPTSSKISFNHLTAGKYQLEIRAIDLQTKEVVGRNKIAIEVLAPFYKTYWAYGIYIVLFVIFLWWINKLMIRSVRLNDSLEIEKREKKQIEELNDSKLHFFTNISHEFRTPLTLILGVLEPILADKKLSNKYRDELLVAQNNGIRLKRLITELLDFRKIEKEELRLQVSNFNVVGFVEMIIQNFSSYASTQNVAIDLSIPNFSVEIWADLVQLEKVFFNLLSNAIKFSKADQGKVLVEILNHQKKITIHIHDNGEGLSDAECAKIFDRFYQVSNLSVENRKNSSGIGLALSKSIIEKHNGELTVNSIQGDGTTFSIQLQKGHEHFDENVEVCSEATEISDLNNHYKDYNDICFEDSKENTDTEKSKNTLLIVEDNEELIALMERQFCESYAILKARNGKEGLEIAIDKTPDVIISDVMMPLMDGNQMCEKLKRNIVTSHIPIILLTARITSDDQIEGLEAGADAYLTKPFSPKLLRSAVKNILLNRKRLQETFNSSMSMNISEIVDSDMDKKLLDRAEQIMLDNIENPEFDMNTFAKKMGLGRTRLFTKIKAISGKTPNELMIHFRLKKAGELLLTHPEMNISEVAYSVGFNTPKYFGKCFREFYGTSPSKYGKQEKELTCE